MTATVMAAAAAGEQADGVVWGRRQAVNAAKMGINWKWEQLGIIVRIFYIGKLLCGLLFICTLQRSLVTSQIFALSEVKAILFLGRYATHLGTHLLLPRVTRIVIPEFGWPSLGMVQAWVGHFVTAIIPS